MSYTKCAYHNCENTSRNISMFRFPVNDPVRLIIWIKNSGNTLLTALTHNELSRRFVCATHFRPSSIHVGALRSRLLGPAVPLPYEPTPMEEDVLPSTSQMDQQKDMPSPEFLKVKTPSKVYTRQKRTRIDEEIDSPSTLSTIYGGPFAVPTPTRRLSRKCLFDKPKKRKSRKCLFEESSNDSSQKKRLKRSASKYLKKIQSQQAKIRRLKKKTENKIIINLEKHNFRSDASKILTFMQLRNENDKKPWSKEEKQLCMSLFYKTPSGYKYLRRQGVVLPAPSTIRNWLSKSDCLPGFCSDIFMNIKLKFQNLKIKDRACVICYDEMSIMKNLEYSKKHDLIEGYEDLGGDRRSNKLAKYALVFMIRGLYSHWKMPVAYFLSHNNVTADTLNLLIKGTVNKLFDSNVLPKAIVCDQMSTNQKVFKDLGVTTKSPFFFVNGRKIYAIFDVPHLIKNVRNNLLNNDYILDGKIVTFNDIRKTFELDKKSEKSRALTKITPKHLNPNNFEKMNVSLATQIFSHTVSASIQTAKDVGDLNSDTAYNTAEFVEIVNNMFDGLNSRTKLDRNPYRCALTKNDTHARKAIICGKNIFHKIQKISFQTHKGQLKKIFTRPPCFDGIIQSIEAILQLSLEEFSENNIRFLITSKLNQDVIENLFALFRQKGGSNRNPSAKLIRTIFRSTVVNSLVKLPSNKNCEEDKDIFIEAEALVTDPPASDSTIIVESALSEQGEAVVSSTSTPPKKDNNPKNIPEKEYTQNKLEECSVTYFAGYIAKRCLDKFKCQICELNLVKDFELTDEKQLLILNKTYGHMSSVTLKSPSDSFFTLINFVLSKYTQIFENISHKRQLKKQIVDGILKYLSCEAEYLLKISCSDHIYFAIDHLILVKINYLCKCEKSNIMELKRNQKLRILKNN